MFGFDSFFLLALLEGTVLAAVLAITALGLSLVFGVMRVVNVAHGEFFMLGAVMTWVVTDIVVGDPWFRFLCAVVISPLFVGAIALIADRLVLSKLDYDPDRTIVATIGFLYILQQGTLSLYGAQAYPVVPPFDFTIRFSSFGYSGYKLMIIPMAIIILLGVWFVLAKTRIGLWMRATQHDQEVAQAFGIPVKKVYMGVLAFGAMLAALGGVLVVPIQQAHYLMGGDPLLLSFIIVIIGGLGSLRGTLVAALLIGLSDGIISFYFAPTLAKMLATFLVAMILVYRPQGLFGEKMRHA